jgi:hypothetical protein
VLISEEMRRAAALVFFACLALTAASTAGARTPQERAHIQARAALDRALAIFRGQGTDPRGATSALLDLKMQMGSLQPAERRVARSLFARPTDGRNGDWTAPRSSRHHTCAPKFCIHWVTTSRDAPSLRDRNHNHLPDYVDSVKSVMTTVWAKEVNQLGYRAPLADGNSGSHHGGNPNNKIDIYLQDVGRFGYYGYCTSDDPRYSRQSNVSAYCVFDDDFSGNQFPATHGLAALKVTAAHEFHHAIQFAYDVREDRWFMEATATNMEATVYPTIHDNYQYFPSSPLSRSRPWRPVDLFQPNGTNQYGSWIYFRFLCEWMTDPDPTHHPISTQPNCSILKDIWTAAAVTKGTKSGGTYSTRAIKNVLTAESQDFVDLFRRFGAANADPAAFYKDGSLYPRAGSSASAYPVTALHPGSGVFRIGMFHMSNDYVRVSPDTGANSLSISIDFPGSPHTPRASVLVYGAGGALESVDEIALNAAGNSPAPFTHSFSSATVSKVVVVLTNAGTRKSDDSPTNDDYVVNFNVSS